MKIVVLDGFTLNPGDLDWQPLQSLGDCSIFDRTLPEKIIDRCKDANIIITNKVNLTREIIRLCKNLKYIGVSATGYNIVDVQAAKQMNIIVTNVPAYSTSSVAQMVFAHILNLSLHVGQHSDSVKNGKWSKSLDFAYWDFPLVELAGLYLGIIGFGQIGHKVAHIAQAFDMNVIFYTHPFEFDSPAGMFQVELEKLFELSDIITLHCPLNHSTENIVNAERIALMKKTAFLINTARGQLIDEGALAHALNNDKIAGAGIDVLSTEPPSPNNPLLSAKNCYLTPHIAWATRASRQRLMNCVVENINCYLDGKLQNVVS